MRNSNYETELCSYDEKNSRVLSRVKINCKSYGAFCMIVESVRDVLIEEEIRNDE